MLVGCTNEKSVHHVLAQRQDFGWLSISSLHHSAAIASSANHFRTRKLMSQKTFVSTLLVYGVIHSGDALAVC